MWLLKESIAKFDKHKIINCLSLVIIISTMAQVFGKCPERCTCQNILVNCSHQNLSELPVQLDTNIIEFVGSYNVLSTIKGSSILEFRVISLEIIDLSHNKIKEIDKQAFNGQNDLRKVDLSFNKLSDIDNEMFQENECLEWLSLSYNSNLKLTDKNFIISTSLHFLNLSSCSINTLLKSNFEGSRNIEVLDVSDNKLIDIEFLSVLKSLRELYINNNRLHSLSSLSWLFNTLKTLDVSNNKLNDLEENTLKMINNRGIAISMSSNPWNCSNICQKIFNQNSIPSDVCKNTSYPLEQLYDECYCSTRYSSYIINPSLSNTEIFVLYSDDIKCTKFIVDCTAETSTLPQEKQTITNVFNELKPTGSKHDWKLKKLCTCSCDMPLKTLDLTSSDISVTTYDCSRLAHKQCKSNGKVQLKKYRKIVVYHDGVNDTFSATENLKCSCHMLLCSVA